MLLPCCLQSWNLSPAYHRPLHTEVVVPNPSPEGGACGSCRTVAGVRAERQAILGAPIEVCLIPRMKKVRQFLSEFRRWAAGRCDILGVVLVGSYARNEATDASDVDLVIVARQPKQYLEDTRWAQFFGRVRRQQFENYGKLACVRIWYLGGPEVEYGFTDETWCAWPVDEGTREVISHGMRVLAERESILSGLSRLQSTLGKPT